MPGTVSAALGRLMVLPVWVWPVIEPSHRLSATHRCPSTLSKAWFSMYSTTTCWMGVVATAERADAEGPPSVRATNERISGADNQRALDICGIPPPRDRGDGRTLESPGPFRQGFRDALFARLAG